MMLVNKQFFEVISVLLRYPVLILEIPLVMTSFNIILAPKNSSQIFNVFN